MDERHDREVGGGGGSEGSEDIEEEAVFTDRLGAEELGQRERTWNSLGTARGVFCTIQYPRHWRGRATGDVSLFNCILNPATRQEKFAAPKLTVGPSISVHQQVVWHRGWT